MTVKKDAKLNGPKCLSVCKIQGYWAAYAAKNKYNHKDDPKNEGNQTDEDDLKTKTFWKMKYCLLYFVSQEMCAV